MNMSLFTFVTQTAQTGSDADLSIDLTPDGTGHSAAAKDSVELLGDPDEGGPAAQLL